MTTRPRRGARGSDRGMMYSGWKLARDFVSRHRFALSFRDVPRSSTMNSAAARQMTLVALLSEAESSQRGRILLGDAAYLEPYQEAVDKIPQSLRRLEQAFASADGPVRTDLEQVERLSNAKLVEMAETLNLYRQHGPGAALDLIRTDIGKWTMSQLAQRVRKIQAQETGNILAASRSWRIDRWSTLAITSTALAASMFLVLLLCRLVISYV